MAKVHQPCPTTDGVCVQLGATARDGGWRYHHLPTGHDAMLTALGALTALLLGVASVSLATPPLT